jgi:hypothetical protein
MEAPTTELAPPPQTLLRRPRLRPRPDEATRAAGIALGLALALVLGGGIGAYVALGPVAHGGFDPPGLVDHLGPLRDALAAPFARWDSVWYLTLARDGYAAGPTTAFFPLYPLLVSLAGALGPGLLVGGVLVSLTCLAIALRLLWLLCEAELGAAYADAPRLAVLATALGPMAFFFTAVYGESLYLALSVGAFLAARRGRWAWAGALGGLAAATRSEGVLLIGALALLWLEQRRGGAARAGIVAAVVARVGPGAGAGVGARVGVGAGVGVGGVPGRRRAIRAATPWPRPRRRDLLWLGLVPLGMGAYLGWLWLIGIDPLAPFSVQQAWYRHLTGPVGGVIQGAQAAWGGLLQLLSGQTRTIYFAPAGGDPIIAAWHNVTLFAFLLACLVPLAGALRRLPPAYGCYALAAIALAVSDPVSPQPLTSLPRYLVVLFPLPMAAAVWLAGHARARRPLLGASAVSLAGCSGLFATWHWIA